MDPWETIPHRSEVVDISAADHTFAIKTICGLHNATAAGGTVTAKLGADSGNSIWYIPAGGSVYGAFTTVIRTGTSLTAANAIRGFSFFESDG